MLLSSIFSLTENFNLSGEISKIWRLIYRGFVCESNRRSPARKPNDQASFSIVGSFMVAAKTAKYLRFRCIRRFWGRALTSHIPKLLCARIFIDIIANFFERFARHLRLPRRLHPAARFQTASAFGRFLVCAPPLRAFQSAILSAAASNIMRCCELVWYDASRNSKR